ncbi:MAG: hypothetical protein BWY71_02424 [Planctomycetes bacterium ADurb.Bin412]|nr:MAG: hypothetical protein BWY71_02424 [Planctomycetes bacterium ADurb.Bin412]
MRAVPHIIRRIGILIRKVVSMHIVYIAVAVVVNAVTGYLAGIDPQICLQVPVGQIQTGINHRHDNGRISGMKRPGR